MSFILSALFAFSVHAAESRPQVALLTSFVSDKAPENFVERRQWRSSVKLQNRLRDRFAKLDLRGYDKVFVADADIHHLVSVLTDPRTVALIWISHGNKNAGFVMDRRGFDLTDIFQWHGSNLKFLSVVSCGSETALARYRLDEKVDELLIFAGIVAGGLGYRKSIDKLRSSLNGYPAAPTSPPVQLGHYVEIRRQVSRGVFSPAVAVKFDGVVVGSLPADRDSAITVPVGAIPFEIEINAGDYLGIPSAMDIGEFIVTDSNGKTWTVFGDGEGNVFGKTMRLFY